MKKGASKNHPEEPDDEIACLLQKETISPEDVIGLTKISSSEYTFTFTHHFSHPKEEETLTTHFFLLSTISIPLFSRCKCL